MRLFLTRRWRHPETKSVFGTLHVKHGDSTSPRFITCEREWRANQPNVSCVPCGFYLLEPHDGTRYQDTFALIGSTVSHLGDGAGVTRSACVFHKASKGSQLQGCIALGDSIDMGHSAYLNGLNAGKEWLAELRGHRDPRNPIYLSISEAF